MRKKATTTKPRATRQPTALLAAQQQRDELRRLKALHHTIGNLTRGIVRAQDAADRRLATLVAVYADRLNKVLVDRAAWDSIRDENADFARRLNDLERDAVAHNELEHAATVS